MNFILYLHTFSIYYFISQLQHTSVTNEIMKFNTLITIPTKEFREKKQKTCYNCYRIWTYRYSVSFYQFLTSKLKYCNLNIKEVYMQHYLALKYFICKESSENGDGTYGFNGLFFQPGIRRNKFRINLTQDHQTEYVGIF